VKIDKRTFFRERGTVVSPLLAAATTIIFGLCALVGPSLGHLLGSPVKAPWGDTGWRPRSTAFTTTRAEVSTGFMQHHVTVDENTAQRLRQPYPINAGLCSPLTLRPGWHGTIASCACSAEPAGELSHYRLPSKGSRQFSTVRRTPALGASERLPGLQFDSL